AEEDHRARIVLRDLARDLVDSDGGVFRERRPTRTDQVRHEAPALATGKAKAGLRRQKLDHVKSLTRRALRFPRRSARHAGCNQADDAKAPRPPARRRARMRRTDGARGGARRPQGRRWNAARGAQSLPPYGGPLRGEAWKLQASLPAPRL